MPVYYNNIGLLDACGKVADRYSVFKVNELITTLCDTSFAFIDDVAVIYVQNQKPSNRRSCQEWLTDDYDMSEKDVESTIMGYIGPSDIILFKGNIYNPLPCKEFKFASCLATILYYHRMRYDYDSRCIIISNGFRSGYHPCIFDWDMVNEDNTTRALIDFEADMAAWRITRNMICHYHEPEED